MIRWQSADEFKDELGLSKTKVLSSLSRLEDIEAVRVGTDGTIDPSRVTAATVREVADAAADREQARQAFEKSRLEMMRAYAEHSGCRRAFVLSYFGEPHAGACGHCDNCRDGRGEPASQETPFPIGSSVEHQTWGRETVQRYETDRIVVLFDAEGYRTLELDAVRERQLLTQLD